MDLPTALSLFWAEVDRSSIRMVAKEAEIPYSTAAGWKRGALPEGKTRTALLRWAESRAHYAVPVPTPVAVLETAMAQTQANLVRLSEISGYAKAVLEMMRAVTEGQAKVVASLAPWVEAEEQVRGEPIAAATLDAIRADFIQSAAARAQGEVPVAPKKKRKAR